MRQILATESVSNPATTGVGTLRVSGTTACGEGVEISMSPGPDDTPSELLRRVAQESRPPPSDRPWVLLNMVTSADGASSGAEGRSASLSSEADRRLFHALRGIADIVLAGASTVRAENYGPPRPGPGVERLRRERDQAPLPRLAVVTGTLRLDPAARLFVDAAADARPIVLTTTDAAHDAPDGLAALRGVADLHEVGTSRVDWAAALRLLGERYRAGTVLVEGGPTVNAQIVGLDLVDEICLTIAPLLVGGSAQRILANVPTIAPTALVLDRAFEDDGFLLLRYLRRR